MGFKATQNLLFRSSAGVLPDQAAADHCSRGSSTLTKLVAFSIIHDRHLNRADISMLPVPGCGAVKY